MNVFSFTGNLGRDAEVRQAGSSTVCGFSVAVKSGFGDKAQSIWIDCSIWGKQAEGKLPEYLLKGQQVAISGELGTREHNEKTYLTCRVNSVDLVGGKSVGGNAPARNASSPTPQPSQQSAPPDDFDNSDIPF
jgi:single-strand DNA-binding protein